MHHVDRERLLADMHSEDDSVVVDAAKGLLQLGEYGTPTGAYLLAGGKAALRIRRLADAVVLLYHGLRVTDPNTPVWAEMLVNRAVACSRHGFDLDAISTGEQFLAVVTTFPQFAAWVPYAHNAVGFAHDRLGQYGQAAYHFRLAMETFTEPNQRTIAACNLASAFADNGKLAEAEAVLAGVDKVNDRYTDFVLEGTTVMVFYRQGRLDEAMAAGERAEALAAGHEDAWDESLAEVRYWLSQAAWAVGNRYRAATLALYAAVTADYRRHFRLRDAANQWLATMMERGGVRLA